jgi:hypothetical protein
VLERVVDRHVNLSEYQIINVNMLDLEHEITDLPDIKIVSVKVIEFRLRRFLDKCHQFIDLFDTWNLDWEGMLWIIADDPISLSILGSDMAVYVSNW